ncbi:hypothetical protein D3C87_1310410 [compost metagenome]
MHCEPCCDKKFRYRVYCAKDCPESSPPCNGVPPPKVDSKCHCRHLRKHRIFCLSELGLYRLIFVSRFFCKIPSVISRFHAYTTQEKLDFLASHYSAYRFLAAHSLSTVPRPHHNHRLRCSRAIRFHYKAWARVLSFQYSDNLSRQPMNYKQSSHNYLLRKRACDLSSALSLDSYLSSNERWLRKGYLEQ